MNSQRTKLPPVNDPVLDALLDVCARIGSRILADWRRDLPVTRKADGSPVTTTDQAAETMAIAAVKAVSPHTIVAEEAVHGGDRPDVTSGAPFWLIDALDGTRDFVRGLPDFTVNIALIEGHVPVLGVVHAPVTGVTWYAKKGMGAYRDGTQIEMRKPDINALRLLGGVRAAEKPLLEPILGDHAIASRVQRSSSLKFCLVADGSADIYPRIGRTSEWDTAAGDIIMREAGGCVLQLAGLQPILYGKSFANFENDGFIAGHASLFK
jgi:3'(2'), 5'-bisphosphate nucleotidase